MTQSYYANTAYQTSTASVATLRGNVACVRISEPIRAWRDSVIQRLDQLVQLDRGWDGYCGAPVSFVNANFALRMLEAACGNDAPPPQIVPGPNADLQIEWHTVRGDIELHVRAPNNVHAWRQAQNTGADGEEVELTNNFAVVAQWIDNLTEPDSAIGIAAA